MSQATGYLKRCPRCGIERGPESTDPSLPCGHTIDVWDSIQSGDYASAVDGIEMVRLGRDWPAFFGDGEDEWDPGTWETRGFVRFFGDAAVGNPFFEVLIREPERPAGDTDPGDDYTELVILCPTFLRRPIVISGTGAYGSY